VWKKEPEAKNWEESGPNSDRKLDDDRKGYWGGEKAGVSGALGVVIRG